METRQDLFKPLYKQHRRIQYEDLEDVLDPRINAENININGYQLSRHENTWTCESIPGLLIIRDFISIADQKTLVKECLVDFLESPEHLTNLDAHHDLQRPINLFRFNQEEEPRRLQMKNEPLIRDKLRWVTLGGQYNWTEKVYPSFEKGAPGYPEFPESLTRYVASQFNCVPEAAIVNYYSEGDILSPHQDVAELTKQDLVSASLGCSCVFYLGVDRYDKTPLPIILRSGDILIMGGDSRFAFHGVGRVFGGTSPDELSSMDIVTDPDFPGWMKNHRININVRQMQE